MIRINIHEAKTHLSRYLKRFAEGESFMICKRNRPIAELCPLSSPIREKRPMGLDKGRFEVGPELFEPLPDDLLDAFDATPTRKPPP